MKACQKCGEPTELTLKMRIIGEDVDVPLCEDCEDESLKGFRECQRQFQFLIDNGVSNERANAIMIRRIDEKHARTAPPDHPNCRCHADPILEDE